MAERLVVVSDMWGSKKGLWITSYLGYLQQYFDIVFYDSRELARIDKSITSADDLYKAFVDGGMKTAVAHLLARETEPSHYLTFCAGGAIAWDAALKGLPVKSLYAVSPIDLEKNTEALDCKVNLLFGELDKKYPSAQWAADTDSIMEIVPNFGHEMYSDEKVIRKVCLDLLESVLNNSINIKKRPLVS